MGVGWATVDVILSLGLLADGSARTTTRSKNNPTSTPCTMYYAPQPAPVQRISLIVQQAVERRAGREHDGPNGVSIFTAYCVAGLTGTATFPTLVVRRVRAALPASLAVRATRISALLLRGRLHMLAMIARGVAPRVRFVRHPNTKAKKLRQGRGRKMG